MKNGLYLISENEYNLKQKSSNGVVKKVLAQLEAFNNDHELNCDMLVLPTSKVILFLRFFVYLCIDTYKKIDIDFDKIDFLYIRIIPTYSLLRFLKKVRKKKPGCIILYEVPTYPYDKEIRYRIALYLNKFFRSKLKKFVSRIVTLSLDDKIFGIPTLKIVNGIDCSRIAIRKNSIKQNEINLIAVATFSKFQGYDRLLEGLNNYYIKPTETKVYLHFIGDGVEFDKYKQLVVTYNLSNFVVFHGVLSGNDLKDAYDGMDIGICSLGLHRKNVYLSSVLKSREYLAYGLPLVSAAKIDVLSDKFKYCLYVPEDESPIDIQMIINFYKTIVEEKSISEISLEIRRFVEDHCDISKTMLPVIQYIKSN